MATTSVTTGALPHRQSLTGMGWRIAVSIVTVFGLVSFTLLYFAFWAGSFSWVQSAVVIVVSVLAFVAANGATWASWGTRFASQSNP